MPLISISSSVTSVVRWKSFHLKDGTRKIEALKSYTPSLFLGAKSDHCSLCSVKASVIQREAKKHQIQSLHCKKNRQKVSYKATESNSVQRKVSEKHCFTLC